MKKILLFFYIVLHATVSFCQDAGIYLSVLSEDQREFRDYIVGIRQTAGDSLLLRTEPIFDKVYMGDSSILGRISFTIQDVQHGTSSENGIWVCMDRDFRLLFTFPIGTEDVGFCEDGSFYNYTTHISTSGDYWYNVGLVDSSGTLVLPAMKRNELSFSAGVYYSYEWQEETKNSGVTSSLRVTVCDTKTDKEPMSVTVVVPHDVLPYIEAIARGCYIYGSLPEGLDDYCKMLMDFMDGCNLSHVILENQILSRSHDRALSKASRMNKKSFRAIDCYLKKIH